MPALDFAANIGLAAKRWPETAAWAQVLADAGIDCAQFTFDLLDPGLVDDLDAFRRVRAEAEQNGVAISSAFTGAGTYAQNMLGHPDPVLRAASERWYERAIKAAAALGAPAVGGHVGALSVREAADPALRAAAIERTVAAVLRIADHAAAAGVDCLLWEIMPVAREYPATMDEVQELMERLEPRAAVPVRLCLDVGHACRDGADATERDPYAWLERLGPWARSIHLQQSDGVADRHWPFTPAHNAEGIIDPERVMALVARLPQARVELALEPIPAPETPDAQVADELRVSAEHWRPALDRARAAASAAAPAPTAIRRTTT
ncbi:MAG TPA: TIM barrel protein [Conexibacter sp.]|nr:TIM barrel protein [Conexibacter sp.]